MLRIPLQRIVLMLVLMLGTAAIVSSISSCRHIDVLDPTDTNYTGGRDTSHGRDTTGGHDTTIVRDTSNVLDTDNMVVNGTFDQNPGTFLPIPSPWEVWGDRSSPSMLPQWSQLNGCGSGFGSMSFYTGGETGLYEEMAAPFLKGKTYTISLCASISSVDSGRSAAAEIEFLTSQDGGMTLISLGKVYTNAMGWAQYSKVVTSPVDSKTIYVVVRAATGTSTDAWVGVDNLHIVQH